MFVIITHPIEVLDMDDVFVTQWIQHIQGWEVKLEKQPEKGFFSTFVGNWFIFNFTNTERYY